IPAHDTVGQRAVVSAYAHRCAILFTNFYKRCKLLVDAIQFSLVLRIGIIYLVEFFLISIISGVDTHLFYYTGGYLGSIRGKVYIGYQWCIIATHTQLLFYFGQVLGFFNTWSGNTHVLTTGLY